MTPYTFTRIVGRLSSKVEELQIFLAAAAQGEYPEAATAAAALKAAHQECQTLRTVIKIRSLLEEQQAYDRNRIEHEAGHE